MKYKIDSKKRLLEIQPIHEVDDWDGKYPTDDIFNYSTTLECKSRENDVDRNAIIKKLMIYVQVGDEKSVEKKEKNEVKADDF